MRGSIAGLLALLMGAWPLSGIADEATPQTEQLSPGKQTGTFAFSFSGTNVRFSQEPAFPVTISFDTLRGKSVASIIVSDAKPFTITADLAPGSYWISSHVDPKNDETYWSALGWKVFIDSSGKASITKNGGGGLLHLKKLHVVRPSTQEVVNDNRPLLQWTPLTGAARYNLTWLVETPDHFDQGKPGPYQTAVPQITFPEDTTPGRRYEWDVWAYDSEGRELGYLAAGYFFTPGGKEAFEKEAASSSGKTGAVLGIRPVVDPLASSLSPGRPAGVIVSMVGDGTPAMKAGLRPGDVITRFNGQPTTALSSVNDFVALVHGTPVGSPIPVEFIRDRVSNSTTVVLATAP